MFTSASSNKLSAQACMGCEYAQTTSKQKLKRPSSVKCGKRCFAAMAVTEDNTGVYVVFQSKHRGHDFKLGGVFLSKSERAAIADKLREGVSMDAVLDNVRSNVDETFHCINLLSKQDPPRTTLQKLNF
nr:uncharacterized protein LOC129383454 [Dermacentor andersoni]